MPYTKTVERLANLISDVVLDGGSDKDFTYADLTLKLALVERLEALVDVGTTVNEHLDGLRTGLTMLQGKGR